MTTSQCRITSASVGRRVEARVNEVRAISQRLSPGRTTTRAEGEAGAGRGDAGAATAAVGAGRGVAGGGGTAGARTTGWSATTENVVDDDGAAFAGRAGS